MTWNDAARRASAEARKRNAHGRSSTHRRAASARRLEEHYRQEAKRQVATTKPGRISDSDIDKTNATLEKLRRSTYARESAEKRARR